MSSFLSTLRLLITEGFEEVSTQAELLAFVKNANRELLDGVCSVEPAVSGADFGVSVLHPKDPCPHFLWMSDILRE